MKRFFASLAVVCMYNINLAHTKVAFADLKDGLVAYCPFNGNANDEGENLPMTLPKLVEKSLL